MKEREILYQGNDTDRGRVPEIIEKLFSSLEEVADDYHARSAESSSFGDVLVRYRVRDVFFVVIRDRDHWGVEIRFRDEEPLAYWSVYRVIGESDSDLPKFDQVIRWLSHNVEQVVSEIENESVRDRVRCDMRVVSHNRFPGLFAERQDDS